jgi:hypothetical protein
MVRQIVKAHKWSDSIIVFSSVDPGKPCEPDDPKKKCGISGPEANGEEQSNVSNPVGLLVNNGLDDGPMCLRLGESKHRKGEKGGHERRPGGVKVFL